VSGLILDIRDVSLSFGGLKAVQSFSLGLQSGDLHGLIGPNGAGKTTVFNLLTGVYRPDSGSFVLDGKRLNGLKPHQIARAGIARTFQNIRLFANLSVLDNARIGCQLRAKHGLPTVLFRNPAHFREEAAILARARALLDLFGLDQRSDELACNLPYGDQRRLEIARALATAPRVLLLDEPAAGMNTGEKRELAGLIRRVQQQFKLTILLIDHDMGLIMDICDHITVLDYGRTICRGTPQEVQCDKRVVEAYLGEESQEEEGSSQKPEARSP
jgi:branched-chain amino acid transport system ATP-binding protein